MGTSFNSMESRATLSVIQPEIVTVESKPETLTLKTLTLLTSGSYDCKPLSVFNKMTCGR